MYWAEEEPESAQTLSLQPYLHSVLVLLIDALESLLLLLLFFFFEKLTFILMLAVGEKIQIFSSKLSLL